MKTQLHLPTTPACRVRVPAFFTLLWLCAWLGVATAQAASPGVVVAWGRNHLGQVTGRPTTEDYDYETASPVALGGQLLSGVTAIAAGQYHTVALKNDGSVVAWGYTGPVPVTAQSGVAAIAAGQYHTVALKNDGSVVAWGDNTYGQTNVPAAAQSGVTAIAAGGYHTVALKNDGSVVVWGSQTNVLAGLSAVTAITAEGLALKGDGSVVAWSSNGLNLLTNVPVAAQSGVTALADFLALKNDGTVVAWGDNTYGQTNVPVAAQSGVTAIAAGYTHRLALKTNGSVVSWGYYSIDGRFTAPAAPEAALSAVTAISAGGYQSLALVTPTAPAISAQPASQNVLAGQNASFTVAATGFPLFYQWRFNNADISVATLGKTTLTLPNVSSQQAGSYSVIVSNQVGVATSEPAILTVLPGPPGTIEVLHSFEGGAYPLAGLVLAKDGHFYGTTSSGGGLNVGTVFRLTYAGALTTLASFAFTNGCYPRAGLAEGSNGHLYGTTSAGGAANQGTVFQVTTNGALTTLVSFNLTNGAWPVGKLVLGSDGYLYGTTSRGGIADKGTVFRVTTSGALTTLVSFDDSIGRVPYAGLFQGSDGYFYGNTYVGGGVFRMTTNGSLTVLFPFTGNTGGNPTGELIERSNGDFYGTTFKGGTNGDGYGTVFRLTTNGALTTLVQFNGDNGAFPWAGLVQGSDGNFYGTTVGDDDDDFSFNDGTVFQVTAEGGLITLFRFNGANGSLPYGALVQGSDGHLYGTTAYGGEFGKGTVFRVIMPVTLQAKRGGNQIVFSWNAAPGLKLQRSTSLTFPDWADVSGSTGTNLIQVPMTISNEFFRLMKP